MDVNTPLFRQHSREWRSNEYVYPVISRRSRGLSIGVNLNPNKACTFDCVYCMVDRAVPGRAGGVDLERLGAELDQMLSIVASGALFEQEPFTRTPEPLRRLNDIAFSGDGEPTASPAFAEACRLAAGALDRHSLDAKVVVITNATLLDRPQVIEALAALGPRGEVWAKLDAGTEAHYQRVNRSKVPFARVLANLREAGRAHPLVIQSLFMRLPGGPPAEEEVAAYLERLRELRDAGTRIDRVQLYTIARTTAVPGVEAVSDEELSSIAERVSALGLHVGVFGAPR